MLYFNPKFPLEHEVCCSIQLLSHVQIFATPWTAARQASLSSFAISQSLLKLMSIKLVMPLYTLLQNSTLLSELII